MTQRDENPAGVHLPLDPLPGHSSRGRLERVLRRGEFAVTAELNPPDSADPEEVYDRVAPFDGWVDAINAVDASGANCHMSSVGICALLTRMGYAPVLQVACRDRNRIAIQGDVLGAAAMGVANILCLTGDGVQAGDQPGALPVFDLDSISLLETARTMRDEARFLSGRKITSPPHHLPRRRRQPLRAALRVPRRCGSPRRSQAGAQFVQTQYCFDVPLFRALHGAGARPRAARKMLHPGRRRARSPRPRRRAGSARTCPASTFRTRSSRGSKGAQNQKQEGKKICIEIMQECREIAGVSGVHVMAYRQEELVAEIVHESGVLAGRRPWRREASPDDARVAERLQDDPRRRHGAEPRRRRAGLLNARSDITI